MNKPKSQSELEFEVSDWNFIHPVGAPVSVKLDNGETKNTKTCSAAWVMGGHSAVIMLEGISVAFRLDRVGPPVSETPEETVSETNAAPAESDFTELAKYDLHFAVTRLPKSVLIAMKQHGKNLVIAGGYIRACIAREPVNDIDFFSPSEAVARTIAASLVKPERRLIETDNAFTVLGHKIPLQFIHRWTFATPQAVVPSFDFTIARAAFWYDLDDGKWQSCCDRDFYSDLAAKRLVYCSPDRNEDAGGSMLRVLKFYQRGYRMPLESLGAVMARMLRGVEEESHLFWTGKNKDGKVPTEAEVDTYRSKILTGLLREVDPNVDPDHIAHIPEPKDEEQEAA